MKQLTTIVMIIMFTLAIIANASSMGEEQFVAKVEKSGVLFVYSTEGRITLIKTEDTAEKIDELAAEAPLGVDVTVVTYADTGNRSPGYKLTYEE